MTTNNETTTEKKRVGLAIQGGVVPAGAFAAGVINGLVERNAFEHKEYDICAFSGTSAGAVIATLCWGHKLEDKIDTLGDDLIKQWTYLEWPQHLAVVPVWIPEIGSILNEFDAFAMKFAVWRFFVERVRTPFLRWIMTKWIQDRIQIDNLNKQFKSRYSSSTAKTNRLGLVLGSADVLRGKIKTFREDDLSLAAVLACGSLYEMGGVTTIVSPPHDGTYLDGAWADNPPLNELLDYGLDEIWLIQCFPKAISEVPRTPAERRERKDELWQNSLVEHELEFVRFVDHWHKAINDAIMAEIDNLKKSGKLPADAEQLVEFLQRLHTRDGKLPKYLDRLFDESNNFAPKKYKQVNVKRIEIMMPRELGSAIVNAPWFIRNLMRLGYEQALRFADNGFDDKPMPQLRPAGWATIASPANDLLYGIKPPSPPTPKPFMKGPIGDALELACDFCPRKAVSTAGELFLDVLPKTVQGALKKMDTAICDFCPKTQMARLAA